MIAYGHFAHGLLTGKMSAETTFAPGDWRAESELFADDAFRSVWPWRAGSTRWREAGREGGVAGLAVAWVRAGRVTSIVGAPDGGAGGPQRGPGRLTADGRRRGRDRGRPGPPPRGVGPLRPRRAPDPSSDA